MSIVSLFKSNFRSKLGIVKNRNSKKLTKQKYKYLHILSQSFQEIKLLRKSTYKI